MRWSQTLIPTLKDDPKDTQAVSQKLLLRGGFIRQHQAGVYLYLPLGWRVLKKVINIIREEMDNIGAQELFMPSLTTREIWEETGRWVDFGPDMFRLSDRRGREMALAPTHEELFTKLASWYLKSYRDLPQIWYQIQTKFRDEPRPRSGILRCREFLMKDSYSFDADWEGLDKSYNLHKYAYKKIFTRSGLEFYLTQASSGLMGGSESEEFMVLSESGEDKLVYCPKCGYSANMEVATGVPNITKITSKFNKLEEVHTPDIRTVDEVTAYLGVRPEILIKSLLYKVDDKPLLVLVRGDYDVNEAKLQQVLGRKAEIAGGDEIVNWFGVEPGFIGPVGLDVKEIIADELLQDATGMVCGANKNDYHLVGVEVGRDFKVDRFVDIRTVKEGDMCTECRTPLEVRNAIEIGHIFKLGIKYSKALKAFFTDKDGKEKPIVMGSYGIGVGRIMASAIELHHDEKGIAWPISISPFDVHIVEVDPGKVRDQANRIYTELLNRRVDVLWDDRNVSPGIKFYDADLIGIPLQVVLGRKTAKGLCEIKYRKDNKKEDVKLSDITNRIAGVIEAMKNEYRT